MPVDTIHGVFISFHRKSVSSYTNLVYLHSYFLEHRITPVRLYIRLDHLTMVKHCECKLETYYVKFVLSG